MVIPSRTPLEQHAIVRRPVSRPPVARVRSWTGRSSVARATDSHLGSLTTAGTRVTRVSAMRTRPVRGNPLAREGVMVATGRATLQRRRVRVLLLTSS
jgi:hypothetical protein